MLMRKIATFAVLFCLASAAAGADQERKQGPSVSEWLKSMQRKIEALVPKKSVPVDTGVAGVRGAKEDALPRLYWKGKKGDESVTEEEVAEFRTAIELASSGNNAAAARELEEFITEFPASPLIPDARRTLELVKASGKDPVQENGGKRTGQ